MNIHGTSFQSQYVQGNNVQSPNEWSPVNHNTHPADRRAAAPNAQRDRPNPKLAGQMKPPVGLRLGIHGPHQIGQQRPGNGHNLQGVHSANGRTAPRKNPAHPSASFGVGQVKVSHTNSKTWTSPRAEEEERWAQVEGNLTAMELNIRSSNVPHDFEEWLEHRVGRLEDEKCEAQRRARIQLREMQNPTKVDPAFGGKSFDDGRGAVLGRPTIWHNPLNPEKMNRQLAEWPSQAEMKEEGDERNTSRFKRFLGLPRSPSKGNVDWKKKDHVKSTEMDSVWELPTKKNYEKSRVKWVDIETSTFQAFLGKNLMEGLQCEPEYKY